MTLLQEEISKALSRLPDVQQREVLDFVRRLERRPSNQRDRLRLLFGSISPEDADAMNQAIEEGCEQIDAGAW